MSSRSYRLGRRQAAVDRTRAAILPAARDLLASGEPTLSAAAVAQRAGVSRITVYNRFGSKGGLLRQPAEGVGLQGTGAPAQRAASDGGSCSAGCGSKGASPAADCQVVLQVVS